MADTADGERLFAGHTGRMFLALTLGLMVTRIGWRLLPPLLPAIIDDLAITPFAAGLALSTAAALFGLLQYGGGRLADGLTRKTAIAIGLGVLLGGAALLSVTYTYVVLLLGVALLGAGQGLYDPADRTLLSDLFRAKRGYAFGLHGAASDVAGIVAAGLATAVIAVATWRAGFLPIVVGAAAVVALVHAWGREPIEVSRVSLEVRDTVGRLAGTARYRPALLAFVLFVFTVQGVTGFLPTFLQSTHGFSPGLANTMFAALFAVGAVTRPVAGRLSDRVPRPYVGAGGLVTGAIGIGLLIVAPSPLVAAAAIVVFGVGQRMFPPAMQAYLMDVFSDASAGGDFGATRTVYIGLGGLGPAYVGFVAGHLGYTAAYAGFVVTSLACGAVLLWLAYGE